MAPSKIETRSRPLWMRLIALTCIVATGWHVFATFLWIAPASGLRDVVPAKALSGYMMPLFGQSWSVFAPEPINGNITIRVRAVVDEGGRETTTEWVDASAAELDMAHHNLFPARAAIMGLQQGTEYKQAYDKLTRAEQKVVAGGYYIGEDWLDRLEENILKASAGQPKKTEKNKRDVKAFVKQEERTVAYATQVALATWGGKVQQVQVSVSRQNVKPFKDRLNPDAAPPPVRTVESGWRGTWVFPEQNSSHFEDVFSNLKGIK